MNTRDLTDLRDQGCEALIVASYDWKICDWEPFLKYAVNFHCSPLPDGRGPYPVMRAILENRPTWGVTCHRVTKDIDAGDILDSEHFPLQSDECHQSLDLKVQMAATRLAARLAGRFTELWEHARPQGEGHYWNKHKIEECVIDFRQSVETVMRHIRAFGETESLAQISMGWLVVKRAVGWTEQHNFPPGLVAHIYNKSVVVAVKDGYIGLIECSLAPAQVVAQLTLSTTRHNSVAPQPQPRLA